MFTSILLSISLIVTVNAAGKDLSYHRPADWYKLEGSAECGVGREYERQSPIHIIPDNTEYKQLNPLDMAGYDSDDPFDITFKMDGAGFDVPPRLQEKYHLKSNENLPQDYLLQQFHFHTPSEHTMEIDYMKTLGKHTPMEIHFVHANKKIKEEAATATEWLSHTDGLAVFGVMFDFGPPNKWIQDLLDEVRRVTTYEQAVKSNKTTTTIKFPHMSGILPDTASTHYYTYKGSLTTPPCYQSVKWYVAADHQTISIDQFINISRVHASTINNRPIQPTNNRPVYRTFKKLPDYKTQYKTDTSAGGKLQLSISMCFFLLYKILS